MDNLIMARSIISIYSTSKIDTKILDGCFDTIWNVNDKIEFLNLILIAHKKRYQDCFSEDQIKNEIEYIKADYNNVFKNNSIEFISDSLVVSIFMFITSHNLRSPSFRETCVSLANELRICNCDEIKYAMYKKLVHCIIHGFLYIEEPFVSLLEQAINYFAECENTILTDHTIFLE